MFKIGDKAIFKDRKHLNDCDGTVIEITGFEGDIVSAKIITASKKSGFVAGYKSKYFCDISNLQRFKKKEKLTFKSFKSLLEGE